ncbi:MAG: SPOR domain-containing protein, partial [Vicinamibacterales bacterium]
MQDEGLHEIQLSGKQLVFFFMAATVAAVVIFLCGVMVGRGVAVERATFVADIPDQAALDPTAGAQPFSGPSAVAGTGAGPLTANETLTYEGRLEDPNPPAETLKPPSDAAPPPTPTIATRPRESTAVAPPTAAPASDPAFKEPAGRGFVVQVAAVRKRAEAETIARRLGTKGYPTFVTTSGANFRVRVGKYGDRRAAEDIAGRLER